MDVDGFEFEPAFQLQRAPQTSELVRKYAVHRVLGLLNIANSYCNEQAVRFGDIIAVDYNLDDEPQGPHAQENLQEQQALNVNGVKQFRVMKGYGNTSYDGQPLRNI